MERTRKASAPAYRTLLDRAAGETLPLGRALRRACGELRFPVASRSPFVFANFASTLDGVVALQTGGVTRTADLVGPGVADRARMGVLRAAADAIVVGAGTVRSAPGHDWTPSAIAPALGEELARLRRRLHLDPVPLRVIVTARGELDLHRPIFTATPDRLRIVTTRRGARRLARQGTPGQVRVLVAGDGPGISAERILRSLSDLGGSRRYLVEGGPHLLARFWRERRLDDLFLTLAPRIVGRGPAHPRLGLVEGLEPRAGQPVAGRLLTAGTSEELLFLRYRFPRAPAGSF